MLELLNTLLNAMAKDGSVTAPVFGLAVLGLIGWVSTLTMLYCVIDRVMPSPPEVADDKVSPET